MSKKSAFLGPLIQACNYLESEKFVEPVVKQIWQACLAEHQALELVAEVA